jgi:hypothetical protein
MITEVDIVALPFMFVCTFVSGFLFNCCAAKYNIGRINELEEQNHELEWYISKLQRQLEQATDTLSSQDSTENKLD